MKKTDAERASWTDAEIARAVRDTLEWDAFIPDHRIHATVSGGRVTLTGHVDSIREREEAEDVVCKLAGVTSVWNRIEVAPTREEPVELRHAIEAAIAWQAEDGPSRISAEVDDGWVTLTGVVHSLRERIAVINAVRATPGVRMVANAIRIEP